MSVIVVENLSKKYVIGHQGQGYRYVALRDIITEKFKNVGKRIFNPLKSLSDSQKKSTKEDFWALKDINFEIEQGERIGIIGRNGAGKSTLLKILSRITDPTTGRIKIKGRISSLLEVGTGFHPELTGRENIYLNGAILGMNKIEIRKKFDEIVSYAEVEKFLDTPVKRYSSGMYLRLAFAVAAHLESEILLVDEVLAVGDAAFQRKCLNKMKEVGQNGRTVLFVSHNMAAIASLTSKCCLMEQGKLKLFSSSDEVITNYLSSAQSLLSIPLSERKDRSGNGKICFIDCKILDEHGNPVDTVSSGQKIKFYFKYKSKEKQLPKNISIAIAITNSTGIKICTFWNYLSGNEFQEISSEGYFICELPEVPFFSGLYSFGIYAEVSGELADAVSDVGNFNVIEGDFFGSSKYPNSKHGIFLVHHSWSHQNLKE
ncbi:MAG: ABC transporter ATP-binding protein [Candidatus Firestonebacteria bacterium]|nr:ABC transporter ATP-binding protein [Candidatus Firestonebacteria bacterium]